VKKILLLFLFFTIYFLLLFPTVFSDLNCQIFSSGSCPAGNVNLLYIKNDSGGYNNAHAQLPSVATYSNVLCCNSTGQTLGNTSGIIFLKLYSDTNSHVQDPDNEDLNPKYTNNAYISADISNPTCQLSDNSCPGGYTCLISIAGDNNDRTNAHVGECNHYTKKVCCKLSSPPTLGEEKEHPSDPILYSPGANYQFNITVCDVDEQIDIDTVFFEFNSTGPTLTNTSITTNININTTCNEYYTTKSSLSAGTYNWKWYANDSTDLWGNVVSGSYTILAEIIPESITIEPDEGDPGIVINPIESSNKTVNVTITLTNSTSIDVCEVRIFNSSHSYSNPVFHFTDGIIQNCVVTCDCFKEWNMSYWRNDGDWNVSVYMNLTTGDSNFTSQNFTYNILSAIYVNTSTINFMGIPNQTVNSTNAYPLEIKNVGNQAVNISINGTDFTGLTNSSYIVGVSNATYNETVTGNFNQLTQEYTQIFYNLLPAVARNLYFRTYLPIGLIQQVYQNYIEIKSE